jgi:hypothetical protein
VWRVPTLGAMVGLPGEHGGSLHLVSSSSQPVVCDFCSYSGHTLLQCFKYLAAEEGSGGSSGLQKS